MTNTALDLAAAFAFLFFPHLPPSLLVVGYHPHVWVEEQDDIVCDITTS